MARAVGAGTLVRVRRGVYAPEPLPPLPVWLVTASGLSSAFVLSIRALLMSWGPRAAARRRSAALLRGWELLVEPRKPEVAVPRGHSRRRQRRVLVQEVRDFRAEDVVSPLGGAALLAVPAWHAVLDAMLSLPPLQAVVLADSALRARDTTLLELGDRAQRLPGRRGAAHVRRLLSWCDEESGSVLESVLRYRLLDAGVTGWRTQVVVSRGTRHVLRTDFLFDGARLVVEVDGARWHSDTDKDRRTSNALAALGYRVLRFSWSDVVDHHDEVLALIREALRSHSGQLVVPEAHAA